MQSAEKRRKKRFEEEEKKFTDLDDAAQGIF